MQSSQSMNICCGVHPRCTNAERASGLSKAVSNRHRLLILFSLLEGEFAVGRLNARVGLSASGCSQHLGVLKRAGLVKTRRDARNIYYSLDDTSARKLISRLYEIYG